MRPKVSARPYKKLMATSNTSPKQMRYKIKIRQNAKLYPYALQKGATLLPIQNGCKIRLIYIIWQSCYRIDMQKQMEVEKGKF
jgi:hypothetical protein